MNLCRWKPKKKYDPINEFFNFEHPFFGLTLFPETKQWFGDDTSWSPAIDVTEEKDTYTVKADLPGLKKEDIDVTVDGRVLRIKGERKYEDEKKEKNYHRVERSYGQFVRTLDLGTNIDSAKVNAKYKDGVLTVSVPKSKEAQSKSIDIDAT